MTGISGYINNSLHLARKYARIFVRGHDLFREATCELQGADDIVSKDKNSNRFSPQMKAIVWIALKFFFRTCALKIGGYTNNSLHLAQKYASISVRGHHLLREANSCRERSSMKTVSFKERIMSKDKYPILFFSHASERAGCLNPRIWLANLTHVTGPAFYDTAHGPDFSRLWARCLNFAPKSLR